MEIINVKTAESCYMTTWLIVVYFVSKNVLLHKVHVCWGNSFICSVREFICTCVNVVMEMISLGVCTSVFWCSMCNEDTLMNSVILYMLFFCTFLISYWREDQFVLTWKSSLLIYEIIKALINKTGVLCSSDSECLWILEH